MQKMDYPCTLTEEDDGSITVTFPDVPEALTCGETRAEAIELAHDALSTALTFYLESGEPLPAPSRRAAGQVLVEPSLQIALKAALADALRESGKRPMDLARMLDTDFKSIKRALDPNHQTRIAFLEKAISALGKRVVIMTEEHAT